MSVRILQNKCVGCGRCLSVCPGNLLKKGEDGKVHIRNIRDCWGCTACLKECHTGAILYFLGADMGGMGSMLSVKEKVMFVCGGLTARTDRQRPLRLT